MAVLISIMVLFYLSLWGTVIHYFVKMPKIEDVDQKIKLTDKSIVIILLEQIAALIIQHIYLAATTKGITIHVEDWVGIVLAVLSGIGFIVIILYDIFYLRKHFPEYFKKGQTEEKYRGLGTVSKAALGVLLLNLLFNLCAAAGLTHFIS